MYSNNVHDVTNLLEDPNMRTIGPQINDYGKSWFVMGSFVKASTQINYHL